MEYIKHISSKKALFKTSEGYKIKKLTNENKPIKLSKDEHALFRRYKYSAAERGYEFELSSNTFKRLIYSNCYYCGVKPEQKQGETLYNGIDRLENTKGYSIENCLACCKVCNRGKSTMDSSEFMSHCIRIATMLYPQMKAFADGDLVAAGQLRLQHMVDSGVITFDTRIDKETKATWHDKTLEETRLQEGQELIKYLAIETEKIKQQKLNKPRLALLI